jgi:tRNA(fMet)-specific endonuclease VapC
MNKANKRYMLDTNTVSFCLKGQPKVLERMTSIPMANLGISVITEGELRFGLAKKNHAKSLQLLVHEFLIRVEIFPWDSSVAKHYGALRADLQKKGKSLGNLDMLIAAHALALEMILVTHDQAFKQVEGLKIEDWS